METVGKRIKAIREETGMKRKEFAECFGIPVRTLEDWEYEKRMPPEYVVRLLAYRVKIDNSKGTLKKEVYAGEDSKRNVTIIRDADGKDIVLINDILFKGKRNIEWKDVRRYLRGFVGQCHEIQQTADRIYIGGQLPIEYTGSNSRISLQGAAAKAKANAAQGIPELIRTATNPIWEENKKEKHSDDAKYGWYKYDVRFALPVYNDKDELERYNIYGARLLVNHAENGKKYLYDILAIKKETSSSQQSV